MSVQSCQVKWTGPDLKGTHLLNKTLQLMDNYRSENGIREVQRTAQGQSSETQTWTGSEKTASFIKSSIGGYERTLGQPGLFLQPDFQTNWTVGEESWSEVTNTPRPTTDAALHQNWTLW